VKRIYSKIFLTVMTLIVSVSIIAVASYAWVTLSTSPSATGMTISIGGGQTILLAADISKEVTDSTGNKVTVHYPGKFSDTLDFTSDALSNVSLSPVSTVDGINWILPVYDAYTGELLDVSDFDIDSELEYANKESTGRYVYVDFWVVSPGEDYNLRVSTDKNTYSGSYLIELPSVTENADGTMSLDTTASTLSASARIGFLVSDAESDEASLNAYKNSPVYNKEYTSIHGVYSEVGETADHNLNTTFTIYEPNGTLHTGDSNGSYIVTTPLGIVHADDDDDGAITEINLDPTRLTVQTATIWSTAGLTGDDTAIAQQFQTAMTAQTFSDAREAQTYFYDTFLGGQISSLLSTGLFFQDTTSLYGAVSAETGKADGSNLATAGATDGAVIASLTKNVPQRIRMFFWLEGQDVDCDSDSGNGYVDASNLILSIELAGSKE
jgi:hypothetical protein